MNIYQFKRDPEDVQWGEYFGFIVRAKNTDNAYELIGDNHYVERMGNQEETYLYDFEIITLASGVVGEPSVLMSHYKGL